MLYHLLIIPPKDSAWLYSIGEHFQGKVNLSILSCLVGKGRKQFSQWLKNISPNDGKLGTVSQSSGKKSNNISARDYKPNRIFCLFAIYSIFPPSLIMLINQETNKNLLPSSPQQQLRDHWPQGKLGVWPIILPQIQHIFMTLLVNQKFITNYILQVTYASCTRFNNHLQYNNLQCLKLFQLNLLNNF